MKETIAALNANESVDASRIADCFTALLQGDCDEEDIAGFLLALKARGETASDIAAAASVMRQHMIAFDANVSAIDVCGTGGDGLNTYNISTATAFVVAACGVPVVKHGNRAVSSASGSTDVLGALGIGISDNHDLLRQCLDEAGLCFLAAPHFHPALKHVMPVRKKLKTRTIFNLLGPLCNPAGVRKQLLGVYAKDWVKPMAETLKQLGSTSAMVVHGQDGLDEVSITGSTHCAHLADADIHTLTITPTDAGLQTADLNAIRGGDATHNAKALRDVLDNQPSAYRDAVILNSAAALIVSGNAEDMATGAALAQEALASGRASTVLASAVAITGA